jgi:aminomuconate-semialdehyde/2-hydroxymuconate-6-semialdehyde dehydrogenase
MAATSAPRTLPKQGVLDVKLFIDGQYVDAQDGKTFQSHNPATGEVIAHVAEASAADVDRAVRAARKAFDEGPWPRMPVAERSALLMKVADGIRKRIPEMAELESLDAGKPIRESSNLDVPRSAYNFDFFAELVKHTGTEAYPVDDKFLNYSLRQPVGVAGCISPWNLPLLLTTWKLGPALACGNTVVVKPAEFTPITVSMLGEIVNEAGLPPGVLNIVQGFGPNAAGEAITTHPGVDVVSFTGESGTGKAIMAASARTLKEISFELGGKAAALIFADADLDAAIPQTIRSTFLNQGEVCLASPRLLVQRPIFDEFAERFQRAAEGLVFGDPLDPATTIGALVEREHYDKVTSYLDIATEEGARLLFGGDRPNLPAPFDKGNFLKPTAFVDVQSAMRICQEEVFGPVITLAPFDTEEEAVQIANDTKYGLAGTIWTTNLSRAHRVARNLNAGIIWVNCWFVRELHTPFGGMKESGIGREGGIRSLDFFSETKNVCIAL